MSESLTRKEIPAKLTKTQFEEFTLPYLKMGSRGPQPKLDLFTLFNYILKLLYLGCQWKELPIEKDERGVPEIHYSRIYQTFRRFEEQGCLDVIFEQSVVTLQHSDMLDVSIIHGYRTTTAAKNGGDNLGYSGHKHLKGDKVVAFCDRSCNVIGPFITTPGNRNESPLLREAFPHVTQIAWNAGLDLNDTIVSLDGVYDSRANRKAIFNRGMTPQIPENSRGRKNPKRGRKRVFQQEIYKERFFTIARVFAWEGKYKRFLLRFERISRLHYALKTLAYTMSIFGTSVPHRCS